MKTFIANMLLVFLPSFVIASYSPQGLTLQGTIFDPSNNPVTSASVDFTIRIISPGAEACILFEETQNLNMSASSGFFSLTIGAGTRTGGGFQQTSTLAQVFSNSSSTISALNCDTGTTFTPSAGAKRKVLITFDDGTGPETITQTLDVQSVPYAVDASQLAGKQASEYLQYVSGRIGIGVSNPAATLDVTGTDAIIIPQGTTAQRPGTPEDGMMRYNSTSNKFEAYQNGGWTDMIVAGGGGFAADGSVAMTGDLNLSNNGIDGLAAGVVATPSIAFNGDADTGLWSPGADTMAVSTNGSEKLRVESGGDVGIGTSNPTEKLDVEGSILSGAAGTAAGDGGSIMFEELAASPDAGSDGVPEYVGFRAPDSILANVMWQLPAADGTSGQVLQTNGSGVLSWASSGAGDLLADGTVAMTGNIRLNNNYLSNDGGNEGIRIDNSGNVGIGTTVTSRRLSLATSGGSNGLSLFHTSTGSSPIIQFKGARGTLGAPANVEATDILGEIIFNGIWNVTPRDGSKITSAVEAAGGNRLSSNLIFYTKTTATAGTQERMRIAANGRIGVGTTAPIEMMDIEGSILSGAAGTAAGDGGSIKFEELAASPDAGTDGVPEYVGFRAPDSILANVMWQLPAADGTSGQVLQTNGSGVLSWTAQGATGATALGELSDASTGGGANNYFLGVNSGASVTTGYSNIGIGRDTLTANLIGYGNVAIGTSSLSSSNTSHNVGIGDNALGSATGSYNIGIGRFAGRNLTTPGSVAMGYSALANASSGAGNVAIGGSALERITTGGQNTAIGTDAMENSLTGAYNVAVGRLALQGALSNAASYNVAVGHRAGVLIGANGDRNVLIGNNAGVSIVNGDRNIFIGDSIDPGSDTTDLLNIGNAITGNLASGDIAIDNQLRLNDADDSNYVGFVSPATVTSDIVWTLPAADGTSGQVLQTNGSGVLSWATGVGGDISNGGNTTGSTVTIGTNDAQSLVLETNNSPAITILNGGDVGIGTSGPLTSLHVSNGAETSNYIKLTNNSSGHGATDGLTLGFDSAASAYYLNGHEYYNFSFLTNDAERMRISRDGDVGIGTTTPASKLHIDAAGAGGGVCVSSDGACGAVPAGGEISAETTLNTGADYAEYFEAEGVSLNGGDLVSLNPRTGKVRRYSVGDNLLGIVSSDPGVIGNSDLRNQDNAVLVALVGQVTFDSSQVNINDGRVSTLDGQPLGLLLANGKVYLNISSTDNQQNRQIAKIKSEKDSEIKELKIRVKKLEALVESLIEDK